MENKLLQVQPPYDLDLIYKLTTDNSVWISDHMMGFDSFKRNYVLDYLDNRAKEDNRIVKIFTDYDSRPFKENYKNLIIDVPVEDPRYFKRLDGFASYKNHPKVDFKNFLCSFNGSAHVSRRLLTAILKKYKWFNDEYCSQCFTSDPGKIDGLVSDFSPESKADFYRKFFVPDSVLKENRINYERFNHSVNIKTLETQLTQSFLHLVSESLATSYVPSLSEKCFYSIVTRGLFLLYAAPGSHNQLTELFGFKLYTRLFDYKFDEIENPIKRLIELTSMISKFSNLSMFDLYDLYLMELDTINYNYDHYFSNDYQSSLIRRVSEIRTQDADYFNKTH